MASGVELADISRAEQLARESRASFHEEEPGSSRGRRAKTEMAFRFLKIEFKDKRLEELYKKFVYRQFQTLSLIVSALVVSLAFVVFVIFLATGKVRDERVIKSARDRIFT